MSIDLLAIVAVKLLVGMMPHSSSHIQAEWETPAECKSKIGSPLLSVPGINESPIKFPLTVLVKEHELVHAELPFVEGVYPSAKIKLK